MMLEKQHRFVMFHIIFEIKLKSTKNSENYIHDVMKPNMNYFVRIKIDICVSFG